MRALERECDYLGNNREDCIDKGILHCRTPWQLFGYQGSIRRVSTDNRNLQLYFIIVTAIIVLILIYSFTPLISVKSKMPLITL